MAFNIGIFVIATAVLGVVLASYGPGKDVYKKIFKGGKKTNKKCKSHKKHKTYKHK